MNELANDPEISKLLEAAGWQYVDEEWINEIYIDDSVSQGVAWYLETLRNERDELEGELKKQIAGFKGKSAAARHFKTQRDQILKMVRQSLVFTDSGDNGKAKRALMMTLNMQSNVE